VESGRSPAARTARPAIELPRSFRFASGLNGQEAARLHAETTRTTSFEDGRGSDETSSSQRERRSLRLGSSPSTARGNHGKLVAEGAGDGRTRAADGRGGGGDDSSPHPLSQGSSRATDQLPKHTLTAQPPPSPSPPRRSPPPRPRPALMSQSAPLQLTLGLIKPSVAAHQPHVQGAPLRRGSLRVRELTSSSRPRAAIMRHIKQSGLEVRPDRALSSSLEQADSVSPCRLCAASGYSGRTGTLSRCALLS